jgi:hypothetical protein
MVSMSSAVLVFGYDTAFEAFMRDMFVLLLLSTGSGECMSTTT